MATLSRTIHASKVMRASLKLRVVMPKALGFRLLLVQRILRLAGFIAPLTVEFVTDSNLDAVEPRYRTWQMIDGKEVPRQLSMREGSPLYRADWWDYAQLVDVYLNGEKQDKVVAYDCDEGFVRRFHEIDDKPVIRDDEIEAIIVRGKVELRPRG